MLVLRFLFVLQPITFEREIGIELDRLTFVLIKMCIIRSCLLMLWIAAVRYNFKGYRFKLVHVVLQGLADYVSINEHIICTLHFLSVVKLYKNTLFL